MPKSWAQPYRTGIMIRNFVLEKGEAYPRQIHRNLKEQIPKLGYETPSYESTRKFIWVLQRLGLIEFRRIEAAPLRRGSRPGPRPLPRRYYSIAPDLVGSPMWDNPYHALYGKGGLQKK